MGHVVEVLGAVDVAERTKNNGVLGAVDVAEMTKNNVVLGQVPYSFHADLGH